MSNFTKTDIANLALIQAGYNTITNFESDTSEIAKKIRIYYKHIYELMLTVAPWQFATKRAKMTRITLAENDTPFQYEYQFPADALYLWDIYQGKHGNVYSGQDVATYADMFHTLPLAHGNALVSGVGEVSGNRVLSNLDELHVFYTTKLEVDPSEFSPMFRDQLVKELEIMLIRSKDTSPDELQLKENLYARGKRANLTRSARQNRKAYQVTGSQIVRNVTRRW